MTAPSLDRYARQMRYAPLGEQGQQNLLAATALVVGCGALGSVIANTLARAGVGRLRLVDRDFLELNNLQRQVLYDESDVAAGLPKAIAAQNRLRVINSEIQIEAVVADVSHENIRSLCLGVDAILDGTDNFETRFLLNDASLALGIPWVYGGCLGAEGQTMTILPGETACLRCLMRDTPAPGSTPTCDTAGVLGPIVNVIASFQANEALKILSGNRAATCRALTVFDMWENRIRQVKLDGLRENQTCPACDERTFPWLAGERGSRSAILCGRNAVQLCFPPGQTLDLAAVAKNLASLGQVTANRHLVRASIGEYQITLFPDGRAIIGGASNEAEARSIYARYVGA